MLQIMNSSLTKIFRMETEMMRITKFQVENMVSVIKLISKVIIRSKILNY